MSLHGEKLQVMMREVNICTSTTMCIHNIIQPPPPPPPPPVGNEWKYHTHIDHIGREVILLQ